MIVITFGVFDYFHYGHLKLLERCKKYGDYLKVGVQLSEEIHKTKPNTIVLYTTEQRLEMINSIRYVDETFVYRQMFDDIKTIDFDVLVVGGDQNHDGIQKSILWAKENGKQVIRLERTPNISTTIIKDKLLKKET